jgi:hypothetical protein
LAAVRRAARVVLLQSAVVRALQDIVEEKLQEKARRLEERWKQLSVEIPVVFDFAALESAPCTPATTKASAAARVAKALRELLNDFDGADAVQERFIKVAASFSESEASLRRLQASCCTNAENIQVMKDKIEQCAEEAIRLMRLFDGKVGDMRSQLRKTIRSRACTIDETTECGDGGEKIIRGSPLAESLGAENDSYTVDCVVSLLEALEFDLCDQPATALQTVADEVTTHLSQTPVAVPALPRLVAAGTPPLIKHRMAAPFQLTTALAEPTIIEPQPTSHGQDRMPNNMLARLSKESREVPRIRQRLNAVVAAADGLSAAFSSNDSPAPYLAESDWLVQEWDEVPTDEAANPAMDADMPFRSMASVAPDCGVLTGENLGTTLPRTDAPFNVQARNATKEQHLTRSSNGAGPPVAKDSQDTAHDIREKFGLTNCFDSDGENDAGPLLHPALAKNRIRNSVLSAALLPGETSKRISCGSQETPLSSLEVATPPLGTSAADDAEFSDTEETKAVVVERNGIGTATCRRRWSVETASMGSPDIYYGRPLRYGIEERTRLGTQSADSTPLKCIVQRRNGSKPAHSQKTQPKLLPVVPSWQRQTVQQALGTSGLSFSGREKEWGERGEKVQQTLDTSGPAASAASYMMQSQTMHRRPATTDTCSSLPGGAATAPLVSLLARAAAGEDSSAAFHQTLFQRAALSRSSTPARPHRLESNAQTASMAEGGRKTVPLWNDQVSQSSTLPRSLAALPNLHPPRPSSRQLAPMFPAGLAAPATSPLAASGRKLVLSHQSQQQTTTCGRHRRQSMTTMNELFAAEAEETEAAGEGAKSTLSSVGLAATLLRPFGGSQQGMASKTSGAKEKDNLRLPIGISARVQNTLAASRSSLDVLPQAGDEGNF